MSEVDSKQTSLAQQFIQRCYSALGYAAFFSLFINLLMLTLPLYMLQVFDRVLTSQSIDTLIYLTLIAVVGLAVMSILDFSRSRMLVRIGHWLDKKLGSEAVLRSFKNQVYEGHYARQCLVDVNTIRQFFSSASIVAFFDAPWIVIYIIIIYFLSVGLGVIATIGAIILLVLAFLNEYSLRVKNKLSNQSAAKTQLFFNASLSAAESIEAMGMQPQLLMVWQHQNNAFLKLQESVAQRSSTITGLAKLIRLWLQIIILCMGAYYVLDGSLTPGGMIAASIILGRGMAPLEQGMSAWKLMLDTVAAYRHLSSFLQVQKTTEHAEHRHILGAIQVEDISFNVMGHEKPILQNIKFTLPQGKQLAIIGPVAAGKSTLVRLLVGIFQPGFGSVRLDGVDVAQLSAEDKAAYIGYLPQAAMLLPGTIQENISRWQHDASDAVIASAEFTNSHQMIMHLTEAYETPIEGYHLSGGQRQRIAITRAFYAKPKFIVLDEPETNLDQDGLVSLQETLSKAKQAQMTVVYVTQKPELAKAADYVLVLKQGRQQAFGPAHDVMTKWLGG